MGKIIVSILGTIISLGLIAVSVSANFRFGWTLGATEMDSMIYGSAAGLADCLKAFLPLLIAWAWYARKWPMVLGGSAMFVVFVAFSLTSAIGFAALNRSQTTSAVEAKGAEYQRLTDALKREEARLSFLGSVRPVGVVAGDVEAKKANRRWASTKGCLPSEITAAKSRDFCADFSKLEGEMAAAVSAEEAHKVISETQKKLSAIGDGDALREADPQAAALQTIAAFIFKETTESHVKIGLIIGLALLVELGSGLGLWVSCGPTRNRREDEQDTKAVQVIPPVHLQIAPQQQVRQLMAPSTISQFADGHLLEAEGERVDAGHVFRAYQQWCHGNGLEPVSIVKFGKALAQMGTEKAKLGGKVRYLDLKLAA